MFSIPKVEAILTCCHLQLKLTLFRYMHMIAVKKIKGGSIELIAICGASLDSKKFNYNLPNWCIEWAKKHVFKKPETSFMELKVPRRDQGRYIYLAYRKSHLLSSYEKLSYCVIRVCERWVHVWSHLAADELMCDLKIGQKSSPMSLHQNEALAFLKYLFKEYVLVRLMNKNIYICHYFYTPTFLHTEVPFSRSSNFFVVTDATVLSCPFQSSHGGHTKND